MKDNKPRVLLLEHQFDNTTGLGITLANLFANWPKEKLAIMAPLIDIDKCEASRPCIKYIGSRTNLSKVTPITGVKGAIRRYIRKVYYYLGLNELHYKFSYNVTSIKEAQSFRPDIIFCCLGSLNSMRDCELLMQYMTHSKLVLYIVDDWVNTKANNRLFSRYWQRKNDKYFRNLIYKATGLLSICPYMSHVYLERYNKTFIPFHNPVDLDFWRGVSSMRKYDTMVKSVIYVGKINDDTKQCLLDMSCAIECINSRSAEGATFILDIYTPNYIEHKNLFEDKTNCHIFPAVPHQDVPLLMKSYDALLLTLGFSKKTKEYVKLSMSTKVSEHLASGMPIILYCPKDIALAQYLEPRECSINCLERNPQKLMSALLKLYDKRYCDRIINNAIALSKDHDIQKVQADFENTMNKCLE